MTNLSLDIQIWALLYDLTNVQLAIWWPVGDAVALPTELPFPANTLTLIIG